MTIQSDLKEVGHTVSSKLHQLGFWIVILIAIGFWIGIGYNKSQFSDKVDEAINLGGMIHQGKVYDVKERIIVK